MYVNPFYFGVFVGMLITFIIMIIWAYFVGRRKK